MRSLLGLIVLLKIDKLILHISSDLFLLFLKGNPTSNMYLIIYQHIVDDPADILENYNSTILQQGNTYSIRSRES